MYRDFGRISVVLAAVSAAAIVMAACAPAASTLGPTAVANSARAPEIQASPAATATATTPVEAAAPAPVGEVLQLTIVPALSEASYSVSEQFFGLDLPQTAVGRTNAVSGALNLRAENGAYALSPSRIEVDLRTLVSGDHDRDDGLLVNYLQSRQFPAAVFEARSINNAQGALETGRAVRFELGGDLTVRDITRPATFVVTATLQDGELTGVAETRVLMRDFGIEPPNIANVLTVQDGVTIRAALTARAGLSAEAAAAIQPAATTTPVAAAGGALVSGDVSPIPPDYAESMVLYALVNRPDTIRRMYISPAAIEAVRAGQPMPSGTRIIMDTTMRSSGAPAGTIFNREKRDGWGDAALSPAERNSTWRYPAHSRAGLTLQAQDAQYCHTCHVAAGGPDYVFTFPQLQAFIKTGQVQEYTCDGSGRTPCEDQRRSE
jgi:polyisoprenoid-binding protein YceI